MTGTRNVEFTEKLLSGYLDGVLVQQDEQRVRLQLEESSEARSLLAEMKEVREAARDTPFRGPPDLQFREAPRTAVGALSRSLGFVLVGVWVAGIVGFGFWELARSDEPLFAKLSIFGIVTGGLLLLLSALLDRLRAARDDPYRGVEK